MCKPIFSKIVSLFAEHNDLQYAAPGGLIGEDLPLIPTLLICRYSWYSSWEMDYPERYIIDF